MKAGRPSAHSWNPWPGKLWASFSGQQAGILTYSQEPCATAMTAEGEGNRAFVPVLGLGISHTS